MSMDFYGFDRFVRIFMDLKGSGSRMSAAHKTPVMPCADGLDPLYIQISDSGGLNLEAWMLAA